jgi:hypothetical protein
LALKVFDKKGVKGLRQWKMNWNSGGRRKGRQHEEVSYRFHRAGSAGQFGGWVVPIVVDDSGFPHWQELAFFDAARKLAEITRGPPKFTATNLTPGYHVFSVLAKDAQGTMRSSNPVMVVVHPLP